ncbi:hypothetical protein [Flavobacterium ovatum]|uniref:PGN_0703 family putative restriction endonuclease n=1 Tax=Flavobacterium ovatum TaxID=1928857 RepID=UPI00344E626E
MVVDNYKLRQIEKNIFHRSFGATSDFKKSQWHKDSDRANSSQALAIDFWGCVKLSPQKDKIINLFFDKKESNWEFIFEFTSSSLLNEKTSTQIDVVIQSDSCVLFLESKFTEADGGGCSQIDSTTHYDFQCNGNYETQTNPVNNKTCKCALTGKGIKYWDYIDYLTTFSKNNEYQPCPFKGGEFQWMRNICFSEAYSKQNNNIEVENYLVYYKSKKCPISKKVDSQTYLGNLKNNIKNNNSFKALSYNDLLDKAICSFDSTEFNEKQIWIDLQNWMNDKERNI